MIVSFQGLPIGLIFAGAVLFLIGLAQGAVIRFFRNSRMALSAHLTAVQCGMALMIFGLIWPLVSLSDSLLAFTAMGSIAGFGLIWAGITLAAATGASRALPIAGEGYSARRNAEVSVKALVSIGSVLSLMSGTLMTVGIGNTIAENLA